MIIQNIRGNVHVPVTHSSEMDRKRKNHTVMERNRRQKLSQKINELKGALSLPECISIKLNIMVAAIKKVQEMKSTQEELLMKYQHLQDRYAALLKENQDLQFEKKINASLNQNGYWGNLSCDYRRPLHEDLGYHLQGSFRKMHRESYDSFGSISMLPRSATAVENFASIIGPMPKEVEPRVESLDDYVTYFPSE